MKERNGPSFTASEGGLLEFADQLLRFGNIDDAGGIYLPNQLDGFTHFIAGRNGEKYPGFISGIASCSA